MSRSWLHSEFERSNRDSMKLDRDVADIRRTSAGRDLGNGGCGAATNAIAVGVPEPRPARAASPRSAPAHSARFWQPV